MIFHFMAREDVQDYKLVESLFDVLGFSNALALKGDGLAGADVDPMAQQLLLSREQLSPIYGRLQAAGRISSGRYQDEERQVGQESIAEGTTSDSYELRFPDELKVNTEVLAVGRDSTGPQVQIAYAVAGSTLEPVLVTRGYLYSVRVRFVATDRLGRVAASIDTTRHFVAPAPVPDGEHLVGGSRSRSIRACSSTGWRSSRARSRASSSRRDTVRVGQPTSASLALSDLVLGSRNTNLFWRRTPQDTVVFNPLRTYKRKEDMELYYEVEGLSAGTQYSGEDRRPEAGRQRRHLPQGLRRRRRPDQPQVRRAGVLPGHQHQPEPQARQAQAGELHAGGAGGGRPGPDGPAGAAVSGG